ncbi:unnamed protein product, partial [Iphiclides podalirius]
MRELNNRYSNDKIPTWTLSSVREQAQRPTKGATGTDVAYPQRRESILARNKRRRVMAAKGGRRAARAGQLRPHLPRALMADFEISY